LSRRARQSTSGIDVRASSAARRSTTSLRETDGMVAALAVPEHGDRRHGEAREASTASGALARRCGIARIEAELNACKDDFCMSERVAQEGRDGCRI